jgi:undecaprenyl-diphosphatase
MLLVGLVGLVAAGWAAGAPLQALAGGWRLRLDGTVLSVFVHRRNRWTTDVWAALSALGSAAMLIAVVLVVCGWWRWRRGDWRAFDLLVSGYVGSAVLSLVVKRLVARPDPQPRWPSSGPPATPFSPGMRSIRSWFGERWAYLAATAAASWRQLLTAWASGGLIMATVGTSRLYLGVHWLTDILAGWVLGGLWLGLVLLAADPALGQPGADQPASGSGRFVSAPWSSP